MLRPEFCNELQVWRTEVKATACAGDSLWEPGELSEKGEDWLELRRPLLLAPY